MARWALIAASWLGAGVSLAGSAHAAVLHVDDSATQGANDGSSWTDAFLGLQSALSVAAPGDEIRVAQGTYRPAEPNGPRAISFGLQPGVILKGGYAGFGSPDPNHFDPVTNPTILSGDLNGDDGPPPTDTDLENSFHVVSADGSLAITPDTILRGFIITAGRADSSNSPGSESDPDNGGGGMILLDGASPTIQDCTFRHNRANHFGGGLDAGTGSPVIQRCQFRFNQLLHLPVADGAGMRSLGTPSITDCAFEHNRDCCFTGSGGGLSASNITIQSCTFAYNICEKGSGLFGSNLVLIDCQFIGNIGTDAFSTLQATLINCRFAANESEYAAALVRPGGQLVALRCEFTLNTGQVGNALRNLGSANIVNCTFLGNRSQEGAPNATAGAVANAGSLTAVNSLFSGNVAQGRGGAIETEGTLELTNCTIVGNVSHGFETAPSGALHLIAGAAHIRNSILWQNTCPAEPNGGESSQIVVQGGTLAIRNSLVEGWTGVFGGKGSGNSGLAPAFIDSNGDDDLFGTADDNPRLQAVSPARDTGDNASLPFDDFDLDADSSTMELVSRDLDNLRRITATHVDRGAYEYQLRCPADIMPAGAGTAFGNQRIDVDDLLSVINRWGQCLPAPASCVADIDGDDSVNTVDLLLVLNSWGPCFGLSVR